MSTATRVAAYLAVPFAVACALGRFVGPVGPAAGQHPVSTPVEEDG